MDAGYGGKNSVTFERDEDDPIHGRFELLSGKKSSILVMDQDCVLSFCDGDASLTFLSQVIRTQAN